MTEAFIILLLIIINGFFSMAETAIVSSSKIKLENEAAEEDEKATKALEIVHSPANVLSIVRIIITLTGILTGVLGGVFLAGKVNAYLSSIGFPYSQTISYVGIVILTTYAFLMLGELIPRRLGVRFAEVIVKNTAGLLKAIAVAGKPALFLTSRVADGLLALFGFRRDNEKNNTVSEEEITAMIEKGTEAGTFDELEQDIVERLFFLSDRNVGSIMTSKMDIVALDITDEEDIRKKLSENSFINYPVYEGEIDNIIGVLNSQKYLARVLAGGQFDTRATLAPPLFVHDKLDALKLLEQFKKTRTEFAVVVDEFGGFSGIVTLKDLFEALVGEVTTSQNNQSDIIQRDEQSWLVDGLISFDEFLRYFEIHDSHIHKENDFYTLSGFVMYITRHIPKTGEKFDWENYAFEVVDMDGLRVDKVLVTKLEKETTEEKE